MGKQTVQQNIYPYFHSSQNNALFILRKSQTWKSTPTNSFASKPVTMLQFSACSLRLLSKILGNFFGHFVVNSSDPSAHPVTRRHIDRQQHCNAPPHRPVFPLGGQSLSWPVRPGVAFPLGTYGGAATPLGNSPSPHCFAIRSEGGNTSASVSKTVHHFTYLARCILRWPF